MIWHADNSVNDDRFGPCVVTECGDRVPSDARPEYQPIVKGVDMGTSQSNILLESGTNEVEILELYIEEETYKGYYGVNVAKVLEIIPMPQRS